MSKITKLLIGITLAVSLLVSVSLFVAAEIINDSSISETVNGIIYLDQSNGNDENMGTEPNEAVATIEAESTPKLLASGTCGDNLKWVLDEEGTLKITGTGKMTNWSYSSSAPWYSQRSSIKNVVIEDGVTSIGDYAFVDCHNLASIEIPDSVTSIGSYAFYDCDSLASVTLGSGVTSIGDYAFASCDSLESITVDSNNAYYSSDEHGVLFNKEKTTLIQYPIGNTATAYNIPDSVTSIGNYAFAYCESLASVTLGNGVISISSNAFYYCYSLASIEIPDSVTSIGSSAFRNCYSLASIEIPDSVTSIGNYAFAYCDSLEKVTVYSRNASYFTNVFTNCPNLTLYGYADSTTQAYAEAYSIPLVALEEEVEIIAFGTCGDNLTWTLDVEGTLKITGTGKMTSWLSSSSSVPWSSQRSSIKNVVIEDGVTSIGDDAFYDCDSLASVTLGSGVTSIGYYAFASCDSLASVTLGNGVISISSNAFYYCSSLASIEIPDSVTSIGDDAFEYCDSLASITLGSGVTSIGDDAFEYCYSLASIEIPDSVTSIGNYAFKDCDNLASITIGSGVTSIGDDAFYYCDSLASITVDENNQYFSSDERGALFNKDKTTLLQYPRGNSATSYIIPDRVILIGNSAFGGCYSLTSIEIPDSVTSIGNYAFAYCDSLTSIEIPDRVTSIGSDAFIDCDSLASVTLGSSVTLIGSYAFYSCDSLASIKMPDSIKSISSYAFRYCSNLKTVYYNGTQNMWNKISIGSYNSPLTSATLVFTSDISKGECGEELSYVLKNDGTLVVSGTGKMTNWSSSSSVPWYSSRASIKNVIIEDGVTSIGSSAFRNCDNLASIEIPDSVTSIGYDAFYYCDSLTSIEIPDSVTSIGSEAFGRCDSLKTVYYNGTQEMWNKISIGPYNSELTYANRIYVVKVKIICEDGEVINVNHTRGDIIDPSCIPAKPYSVPVFYKDENRTEKISVDIPISESVTLYLAYETARFPHTFLNEDGSVIKSETVEYGSVITPPEAPEKAPTVEFTYTFAGWEGFTEGMVQNENALTFTATYTATKNKYTHTFLNEDGSVIKSETVEYGSVITPPEAPTKAPTAEFTYTFAGWAGFTEGMTQSEKELVFTAVYKVCVADEGIVSFEGAQIRTDNPQGLRFIFSIPRAIYDMLEHPKSPDDKGIGFGSVVMPKKYLGDNELTKETSVTINNKVYKSKIAPAVNLFEITDDEVKFTVCVIEIPEKNYTEEYVAVPYMTYIENGEEITVYGEKTEGITVFTIAEMAYADNKTSEVDKEYLYNNILSVVDPKKYPTNK